MGVAAIAAIVAASAWLRAPGFTQGGFASHDVAGILYNAMLLKDGALPYVDSLELKSPGSFWLATWLAGPEGRDIARFQMWANGWGLASLVALATIAARTFGARAAVVAAALYALHDAHLDSMDANYVTWAQLPALLAFGWGLAAMRTSSVPGARLGWAVAGALAGAAMMIKHPAGAALLAVSAMALLGPGSRRRRLEALAIVLAGAAAAHLPLAARYAAAGQLPALVDGYVLPRWGLRYVTAGSRSDGTPALVEGAWATAHFLALPLALAAASWRPPGGDLQRRRAAGAIGLFALFAAAAASVGLRYYKGYFLLLLPPLCLLAAAPWGLLGTARRMPVLLRALLLLPVGLLFARQLTILPRHRADRAKPHDLGGRAIAAHVGPRTVAGDRIWVWGWHLWDVYPLTGLRSASRIYKSLGVLTPPNDDTWRLPASPLRFVDGPAARELLADLERVRPAWIVLGSTVPRGEFTELRRLLHREYAIDRSIALGRVQFWRRRTSPPDQSAGDSRDSSSGS